MRVIYTSKGMSKNLGCALYIRCALSVEKYGNCNYCILFDVCCVLTVHNILHNLIIHNGMASLKFIASQARSIHQYKNLKINPYPTNVENRVSS